ncbi:T-box protein 2 isoform X2 [Cephus cinctus]|nr:T-box protein 2 isoform X2 [Cephus cinctus]XP_024940440.1 T-box protein 2 isoform X2 [Cephus cinctus]
MFPSVQLVIRGLERRARYCLLLEVAPASRRRHKYVGGGGENGGNPCARGWTSAGPAEPQPRINRRVYLHPDSPATGAHWMQHPVSFSKLKLTNNAVDHHNNVVLTSMHKYIPKIWVIRCDDATSLNNLYSQPASSFTFDETEFIAVTAYQNENITKLKIDNNPFAKGFRETGQSRCKRKLHHVTSSDSGLDSSQEHCAADDEEENNSSSESESNRIQRPSECEGQRLKRAFSETGSFDDSGVSSSGGASPPLPSASINPCPRIENHNPTPRLHRPWSDSPPPVQQTPEPKPLHAPLPTHFQLLHPFVFPSHHLTALEFARIHQMHRYQAAGYLSKFYP